MGCKILNIGNFSSLKSHHIKLYWLKNWLISYSLDRIKRDIYILTVVLSTLGPSESANRTNHYYFQLKHPTTGSSKELYILEVDLSRAVDYRLFADFVKKPSILSLRFERPLGGQLAKSIVVKGNPLFKGAPIRVSRIEITIWGGFSIYIACSWCRFFYLILGDVGSVSKRRQNS